jgi:predicted Zn-dependent protease
MGASDFDQAVDAFRRGDLDRARTAAEAALQSSSSPRWQYLLGLVHCRDGHPSAGLEHLRAASQAEPENVAYRVMLARALLDCGRAGEALETAAVPSGTSPAELALWHVRAQAAEAVGDMVVSLEALGRLCAAGIADWRVWSSYGGALGASGRWLHAAHAFRRATELNPKEAALRRSLATALARAGH